MSNLLKLIKENRIYFDGAMGTMLQKRGISSGELPETWNLTHPDVIEDIHCKYLSVGANVITTNTFGANCLKFDNYEEIIAAGIRCAKKAASNFENAFVAYDIGPLGKFLEPIGTLPFEEAVEIFAKGVRVAELEGVDLIVIETMSDSYETKAAVLAAKENSKLPIFVTNVYDENGKTLTGSSVEAMVALLEGLGVDAIGMNCSLGPDKMIPIVERMARVSSTPIIVNPNAGLPELIDGVPHYSIDAEEYSEIAIKLAGLGANILGGCCGTNPEYIRNVVRKTKDIPIYQNDKKQITVISSYTNAVEIGRIPLIIGERINPTGKPRFQEALRKNDINYIIKMAIDQEDVGAHILDVNVGLPDIDEAAMMSAVVSSVQAVCSVPLQLDSNNPIALERAMRIYNGKPLINSVNGDPETMDAIFPLVKKYGGSIIALTLDKNGIPKTAEERVEIAERILDHASKYGIDSKEIIFDALAMTVSTDINNARITIDAVKMLNERGYKTSLGISNVSFGLPNRAVVNNAFLALALNSGLSCAIVNPSSPEVISTYKSFVKGEANDFTHEDFLYSLNLEAPSNVPHNTSDITLGDAIVKGLSDYVSIKTREKLSSEDPLDIINNTVIPALNLVGEGFENKTVFLPQLLRSADCASNAFSIIKEAMPQNQKNGKSVILATVKGDIHDIGKNIVRVMLESYGFEVYDLGKDVAPGAILEAVKQYNCKVVALSALMTTTLPAMEKTVKLLHDYDKDIKVMVGGAVLNQEYANMIGADAYGKDAMAAVKLVQTFYK